MTEKKFKWEEIQTEPQRDKLVELTIKELDNLRDSRNLKCLLKEKIQLAKAGNLHDRYFLYISREGYLEVENHYLDHGDWEDRSWWVQEKDISSIIQKYRLTPQGIRDVQERLSI